MGRRLGFLPVSMVLVLELSTSLACGIVASSRKRANVGTSNYSGIHYKGRKLTYNIAEIEAQSRVQLHRLMPGPKDEMSKWMMLCFMIPSPHQSPLLVAHLPSPSPSPLLAWPALSLPSP